ncbi:EAL domain-containing protein [Pseudomonas sp. TNT11]|uniref:EAL domain-containing protein n=1 Tax=Pseudomonas emilianonis TaxID=2915812 RepID=A0ABT0ELQ8_9PSED|nr:EAL domain-containing protein [Pseudomonas emilianonis]MCK1786492.1 EAL domain-containing protein [Pseudomonas emilianonis]
MNNEKISPAEIAHPKLFRQAIVERNCTLWGNEIRVTSACNLLNLPEHLHPIYREQLKCAYRDALLRIAPRTPADLSHRPLASAQPATHKFLRIDQSALMSEDTLNELIHVANVLESYKQQLVISVENPLDALPGPTERRAMVRQLYALKDRSGIKIAYNNYTLDTKQADLLIELKLYDYIKMPFPDAALRLSLNTRSDLFDRLYDHMLELISATRISFIADKVEFSDSATLAKRLPFNHFQGSYYSPPESL